MIRRMMSHRGSQLRESSDSAAGAGSTVVSGVTGASTTGATVGCGAAGVEGAREATWVTSGAGVGRDSGLLIGTGLAVGVGITGFGAAAGRSRRGRRQQPR